MAFVDVFECEPSINVLVSYEDSGQMVKLTKHLIQYVDWFFFEYEL